MLYSLESIPGGGGGGGGRLKTECVILFVWAAPGVGETLPKGGGLRPHFFGRVSRAPESAPDLQNVWLPACICSPHWCHPVEGIGWSKGLGGSRGLGGSKGLGGPMGVRWVEGIRWVDGDKWVVGADHVGLRSGPRWSAERTARKAYLVDRNILLKPTQPNTR